MAREKVITTDKYRQKATSGGGTKAGADYKYNYQIKEAVFD